MQSEPGLNATKKLLDLLHSGRHAECELAAAYLLDRYPEYGFGWKILGVALQVQGRRAQAFRALYRAAELLPRDAEAQGNLGLALIDAGELPAAEHYLRHALEINPDDANAWNNLGHGLCRMGRLDEAETCLHHAVELRPDAHDFLYNLASILQDQGRIADAMAWYEKTLAIAPLFPHAHWNLGMCLLQQGKFAAGWKEYEWRWQTPAMLPLARPYLGIRWTGAQDLAGKTILAYAEQGLGDTLQFCRYASLLATRGTRVILHVPATLLQLVQSLDGVADVTDIATEAPSHDFYCPLMSLPMALGTDLSSIPAPHIYLRAPATRIDSWRRNLEQRMSTSALRIGVAWSGNRSHKHDYRRSVGLDQFASALGTKYNLVSLQTQLTENESASLKRLANWLHFDGELNDFSETAALISHLGLVVTVDTAVAHLAGAMGKDTWLLLSFQADWRWLEGRQDSPWYPSMRLFRQARSGDWQAVLQDVKAALQEKFPVPSAG
ncbi:MAG TPA: tetratricopeptide repeat protein [Burkholderiaceae bacterium]|jgi:tetratricopeptide (TPR) repeat protein